MTDNPNPLPGPRKAPDSGSPLPAWMTLPGSLVQPASPEESPALPSGPDLPVAPPKPSPSPESSFPESPSAGPERPSDTAAPSEAAPVSVADREEDRQDAPEEEAQAAGPALEAALEAILMVVDEPVAEITLAQVLERPTHEVAAALRGLAKEYTDAGRGFDLREVAGGWRFYTRADCAALVERFVRDGQQTRLTQAALETLAVVAYRQPVSRARVAAVRGVNSDGVMRTLVARGLVEEAGTDPESQAVLYRTSSYFLERLGLRDLSELPELAPFLPDDVENLEETTK